MQKLVIPQIEIKLSYKDKVKQDDLYVIKTIYDVEKVIRKCFNADTLLWREEVILLCLNRANKVVGFYRVSVGGLAQTTCDPKVIFTIALNTGASGIILAHNHPSGNLMPSQCDIEVSKKINNMAKLLDITFLDNLIITQDSYYSFAQEGHL